MTGPSYDDTRFWILRLLSDNPEISHGGGKALAVSIGGVHYALSALVDRGLVKLGNV